jgi:hypothetical protein
MMDKSNSSQSPYYPPRANLWSPIKYLAYETKEIIQRWNYRLANKEYAQRISLLPFVIPGFGFIYAGKTQLGRLSLVLYLISAVFFLITLGFKEANYILAIMVFIHSINLIYYLLGFFGSINLRTQVLFNIAISVVIVPAVYYLLIKVLFNNFIIPINYKDTVLVGIKMGNPQKISAGSLILFKQIDFHLYYNQIRIIGGLNLGKIIAKEGEKVTFNKNFVTTKHGSFIKPVHYPILPELKIPNGSVFVLTEMSVSGNLTPGIQQQIENIIVKQSIIGIDEYKGYIPKTWFGRIQYY